MLFLLSQKVQFLKSYDLFELELIFVMVTYEQEQEIYKTLMKVQKYRCCYLHQGFMFPALVHVLPWHRRKCKWESTFPYLFSVEKIYELDMTCLIATEGSLLMLKIKAECKKIFRLF